jgi:AraC-like DNA-binding protein
MNDLSLSNKRGVALNEWEHIEHLNETYRKKLSSPELEGWPQVQRAVRFIHSNLFDRRLTVAWIRRECRITDHNFSARFAWLLRQTPEHYILHHRIAAAKLLLRNGTLADVHLTDIALSIGFHSLSTFDIAFKKQTGCTPGKYRKTAQNG